MASDSGSGGAGQIDARIVYWGIEGAGVKTNLQTIHARLRADLRGELRRVPTRLDPSTSYPMLPIQLGDVGGVRTRLQILGMPPGPDQVAARKQLLDRVDGLVLVIDCQPERFDENLASYDELRRSLSSYGRSLADVPVVVQYNKRDLAKSFDIESLHRKLDLRGAAVFEAVAREGTGVLQTLTTVSKRVIRVLNEHHSAPATTAPVRPAPAATPPPASAAAPATAAVGPVETLQRPSTASTPVAPPSSDTSLEEAILLEGEAAAIADETLRDAQQALDRPWNELEQEAAASEGFQLADDLRIVEVGVGVIAGDRSVRVPLTLENSSGQRAKLAVTIALDPLLDPDL